MLPTGCSGPAAEPPARSEGSSVNRDLVDLALAGPEAEAALGDVERSVTPDCHSGRERQARDDRLGGVTRPHAHDRARARCRAARRRAHLERVQLAAVVGEPEHLLEPGRAYAQAPVRPQLVDVLVRNRAVRRAEEAEVPDVPHAVMDERGRDHVPPFAEMSITRLIAPAWVTRSSSPWFESIGYSAPLYAAMLYHVPSGSKSSSSGFATG